MVQPRRIAALFAIQQRTRNLLVDLAGRLHPVVLLEGGDRELAVILPVLLVSGAVEIYILVTYLPRFVQIYRGTHDTFE